MKFEIKTKQNKTKPLSSLVPYFIFSFDTLKYLEHHSNLLNSTLTQTKKLSILQFIYLYVFLPHFSFDYQLLIDLFILFFFDDQLAEI